MEGRLWIMKNVESFRMVFLLGILVLMIQVSFTQSVAEFSAEGHVVAYKKSSRCPTCKGTDGSIGLAVENWIVRIDKWNDEKVEGTRYILVEYQMYQRSLTETEINEKLKFVLRERMEHEQNQDCVGEISVLVGDDYFLRPAEFIDYQLTEAGDLETIPTDFKKLPCMIVVRLPVVIK